MQSYAIQQGQTSAGQPLLFLLVSSTDHISPITSATPTVKLSKNGGAFNPPIGAVSEVGGTGNGNGWYQVAANATDASALGPLALHATATGADPCDVVYPVVAYNPLDPIRLGLTALPTVAPALPGGFVVLGAGAGQINVTGGGVDLRMIMGASLTSQPGYVGVDWGKIYAPTTAVALSATTIANAQVVASVTNPVAVTPAPPTAAQIATAVWTDATAGDFATVGTPGKVVMGQLGGAFTTTSSSVYTAAALANAPTGGGATAAAIATAVWTDATASDFTTAGTPGFVLKGQLGGAFGASGSVYTAASLANAPTGGGATAAQIATAVWQDATAGDFAVAGSIGRALFVNAAPGAAGGHFLAGTNAATTVNFTGTLSGSVGSVVGNVGGSVGSVAGNVGGSIAAVTGSVGSVAGNVAGSVGSVAAPVTVGTVNDKAGYKLDPTGLDQISTAAVTGPASTWPQMMVQTWRRLLRPSAKNAAARTIQMYADNGTTVLLTQAFTDDGSGNETLGSAS